MNDSENYYLVKGDISGIQDFIFNVKSKGAAKSLKARSFFIEAIGYLAEKRIKSRFGGIVEFFNGGGNFYTEVEIEQWNIEKFNQLKDEFFNAFKETHISLNLSYIETDNSRTYGEWVAELNKKMNREKLTKYQQLKDLFDVFDKTDHKSQDNFAKLAGTLSRSKSYTITPTKTQPFFPDLINNDSITLFGNKLTLLTSEKGEKIFPNIPIWDQQLLLKYKHIIENNKKNADEEIKDPKSNTIIDFGYFADFADDRTGTSKLGLLKLDIDNLGHLFQGIENKENNKFVSNKIEYFFKEELTKLINGNFSYIQRESDDLQTERYRENNKNKEIRYYQTVRNNETFKTNIYVIFSGGDDCFLIGAWDAIIEFTIVLKERFDDFEKNVIRKTLNQIKEPITFSAAILLVDHHFPVAKMADVAEERLHIAKTTHINPSKIDATGKPMKNKISFMENVFTWDEFYELSELKGKMQEMIVKFDENKGFVQRIIRTFNIDSTYWKKHNKPFNPAILWRFPYQFRDIVDKNYFQKYFHNYYFKESAGIYQTELKDAFNENRQSQKLPLAARWTEFLTRKI